MEKLIVETYLVGRKKNYENRVIKEIITLSRKLEFNLFEHGTTYPAIELINSAATKNEELNLWIQTNLSRDRSIIKFSSEVPLVDMLDTENLVYTTNERENQHALEYSFQKRIMDVIVATNIADAGSFEVLWSKTRIDQRLYETSLIPEIVTDIFEIALDVAYQYEWPVIRELPFLQVWNWSHQNHKIFDDFKKGGRVSRAVNAFSRLLESPAPQDFSQYLLWSMVGIETLYVRGKVSIMEQVREKIQIFLGKQERNRKIISNMYDFRSRLMHGDLPFPGINFVLEADKDYWDYVGEMNDTVGMAVAILISTLQEIIVRDWRGIEFSYQVNDIS